MVARSQLRRLSPPLVWLEAHGSVPGSVSVPAPGIRAAAPQGGCGDHGCGRALWNVDPEGWGRNLLLWRLVVILSPGTLGSKLITFSDNRTQSSLYVEPEKYT